MRETTNNVTNVRFRDSKDILRSCGYYDWNYTEIAAMGYNAASAIIAPLPPVKQCLKRSFLDSEKGKSIESEVRSFVIYIHSNVELL